MEPASTSQQQPESTLGQGPSAPRRASHASATGGEGATSSGHSRRNSLLPASQANDFDEEALDEIRRYESFSTVDWIADSARERGRAAREARKRQAMYSVSSNAHLATNGGPSSSSYARSFIDPAWGKAHFSPEDRPPRWWPVSNPWGRRAWWVWRFICGAAGAVTDSGVVVLVGLLIGVNMAIISLATEWASDLKQGYCSSGWWLNRKFCCGEFMDAAGPGGAALPPPAVKAAQAAATTMASAAPTVTNVVNTTSTAAVSLLASRASALANAALLLSRADASPGSSPSTTPADVCEDWVAWSSWTFPSWIIYILFAAVFSSLCAHMVRHFAPYAAGSGISEIKCILAGFIINGFLGAWTLAIKSLALPLAIASGLSVGKEGPAVHIACCIGNLVAQAFRSFNRSQGKFGSSNRTASADSIADVVIARMRELLTAASAAGVAVAFGSPIGGVLFSLEEMAYNFPATTMWRSFLCALAATVALSFMNPFQTGKLVLFQVSYDRDWHYFEIIFYIVIGIFGGLYGALVIKYNLQVQKFRRENLAAHGVSEACVLAVLTAFIGYWNMFLRIDMTESLEILFRECEGGGDYDNLCQSWAQWRMVNSLLLATVLRIALVIISYGCKVPAGIFVPSMAIGATFGRMIGIIVKSLHNSFPHSSFFSACQPDVPCITPGTYAFLGAAAALAGVTRITVAVVVIMFELTGALTYILPTMLVVMITKGVGDWYGKGGIAEQTIRFQGFPFLDKDDHVFNLPVSSVMTRQAVMLYASGMQLREVEAKLAQGPYKGFPVVRSREDRTLLGYAGKTELRYAIGKARRVRSTLDAEARCQFSIDPTARGAKDPEPLLDTYEDDDYSGRASGRPSVGRRETREEEEEEAVLIDGDRDEEEEAEGEGIAMTEDGVLGAAGGGIDMEGDVDVLELGGWVEQNPLLVQPSMPLEVVMELFKKLGPRVILVSQFGLLKGLVTVKDVLKLIAAQERRATASEAAAREMHSARLLPTTANAGGGVSPGAGTRQGIRTASSALAQSFATTFPSSSASHGDGSGSGGAGEFGGELEVLLRDALDWARKRFRPLSDRYAPAFARSRRGRPSTTSWAMVPDEEPSRSSSRSEAAGETSHFVVDDDGADDDDDGTVTPRA